jgi:hypothetical protein
MMSELMGGICWVQPCVCGYTTVSSDLRSAVEFLHTARANDAKVKDAVEELNMALSVEDSSQKIGASTHIVETAHTNTVALLNTNSL